MTEEPDRSLEIMILAVLGVFAAILGVRQYTIGGWPSDGAYGLFLVIIAFQAITLGKTPFGDFRRSWALILIGEYVAVLGMSICFIPGYFSGLAHVFVGTLLLFGGLSLLIQLCLSENKARVWLAGPAPLRRLALACILVYAAAMALGVTTLLPGILDNRQEAGLLFLFSGSVFYLSWRLRIVYEAYPARAEDSEAQGFSPRTRLFEEADLPLLQAFFILIGILLTFLGLLLFPVTLGMVPFSPDGQAGLMLTITAIQMLSLGETPLGRFKRSPLLMVFGFAFAGLGVVSSVAPGVVTGIIMLLFGIQNLAAGAYSLTMTYLFRPREIQPAPAEQVETPPDLLKLLATQTALSSTQFFIGLSTIAPLIFPILQASLAAPLITAAMLTTNGLLLFALVIFIGRLDLLQRQRRAEPAFVHAGFPRRPGSVKPTSSSQSGVAPRTPEVMQTHVLAEPLREAGSGDVHKGGQPSEFHGGRKPRSHQGGGAQGDADVCP